MAQLRVVYMAAGPNAALLVQARYALLSAMAWRDGLDAAVHLYSDNPESFADFAGHVQFENVGAVLANAGSPFAAKLRVVGDMCGRYPDSPILFVDSDTFFKKNYAPLAETLESGLPLLHRREYLIVRQPTGQMRRFRRSLRRAGITVGADDVMWNSGVIGLPPGRAAVAERTLKRMERIVPYANKHAYLAEQFSISTALPNAVAADEFVFHYWYQKPDYTRAIRQRLDAWAGNGVEKQARLFREAPSLRLSPHPQKLHWWERALAAARLRELPVEIRGLD